MLEQRGLSSLRSHGLVVECLLAEQDDLGLIPAVLVFFSPRDKVGKEELKACQSKIYLKIRKLKPTAIIYKNCKSSSEDWNKYIYFSRL